MSTLGPQVDGAIANTLSRLELVRQVAAADARSQLSGGAQDGFSELPSDLLAFLASEASRNRHVVARLPPVVAPTPAAPVEAELPSQSVHTFPSLPTSRTQQTWHPTGASVTKPPGSGAVDLPGPWRPLKRRPVPCSTGESKQDQVDEAGGSDVDYDDSFHTDAESANEPAPVSHENSVGTSDRAENAEDVKSVASEHYQSQNAESSKESLQASQCNSPRESARMSPGGDVSRSLPETATPLDFLRTLLLDAARVAEWYPVDEKTKLIKADILGDKVPQILNALEAAVLDAVLLDTATELTRLDISRALAQQPKVKNGTRSIREIECEHSEDAVVSYVQVCAHFEETLRQKYL